MSTEANRGLVEQLIENVFNRHDVEAIDALVSPDVVDHNAVIFARREGGEGVAEGVRSFLQAFPNLHVTSPMMIAEGDRVVARLIMRGTNTGEYRGLPWPTNRIAEWESVAIFRISDGRIVEVWGVADRLGMLTQLGIVPGSGR